MYISLSSSGADVSGFGGDFHLKCNIKVKLLPQKGTSIEGRSAYLNTTILFLGYT